jgi:hypothetical protein
MTDRPTDYQDHPISLASYLFTGPYEYPEFYNSRSQISSLQTSLERLTNLSSINSATPFSPLRVIHELRSHGVGIQTGVSTDIGVLTDSSRINIEVDPSPRPRICMQLNSDKKQIQDYGTEEVCSPNRGEINREQESTHKKCCSTRTETEESPQNLEMSQPERSRYDHSKSHEFSLDDLVSEDTNEMQHDLSYSLTANEDETMESIRRLSDKSIKELNGKGNLCKAKNHLKIQVFDGDISKESGLSGKSQDLYSVRESKSFSFEANRKKSQQIQRKIETIKDSYLDLRPQPKPQHKIQQRSIHSFIPDRSAPQANSMLNSSSSLKRLFIPAEDKFKTEISPTSSNFLDSVSNFTNSPIKHSTYKQALSPFIITPMRTPTSKRTVSVPKIYRGALEDSYILRESDLYRSQIDKTRDSHDLAIPSRVTHSSQTMKSMKGEYIQNSDSDISNQSEKIITPRRPPIIFKNKSIQTRPPILPSPSYNHIHIVPSYTSPAQSPSYYNKCTNTSLQTIIPSSASTPRSTRDISTSINTLTYTRYQDKTTSTISDNYPYKNAATSTVSPVPSFLPNKDQEDAVVSISVHSAKNFYNYTHSSNIRVKIMLELASAAAPLRLLSRSIPAREKFGVNYTEELSVDWNRFKSIYRSQPIIIEVWEDYPVERRVGQTELHIGLLCCSNSSVYGWYNVTRSKEVIGQLLVEVNRKDLPSNHLSTFSHRYFEHNTIDNSLQKTKKIQQGNFHSELTHLNQHLLAGPGHAPSPKEEFLNRDIPLSQTLETIKKLLEPGSPFKKR